MTVYGRARHSLLRYVAAASIVMSSSSAVHAVQGIDDPSISVRSPEDVVRWLSRDFTYEMRLGDIAHSPEDTISSRAGDCDDFAILASALLERIGVENQVLVIRFSSLNIAHAICIWKEKNGTYSFISSRELCRTGMETIEAAVRREYPDVETIACIDPKVYADRASSSRSSCSKSYHGQELMTSLDGRDSVGL